MESVKFIKLGQKNTIQGIETLKGGFYVKEECGVSNVSEKEMEFVENLLVDKTLNVEGYDKSHGFSSYRNMAPEKKKEFLLWLASDKSIEELEHSLALFYLHGLTVRILAGKDEEDSAGIEEYLLSMEALIMSPYEGQDTNYSTIPKLADEISEIRAEWLFLTTKYDVREDLDKLINAAGTKPEEAIYDELQRFFGCKEFVNVEELYHLAVLLGFFNLYATERLQLNLKEKFHAAAEFLGIEYIPTNFFRKPVVLEIPLYNTCSSYFYQKKKMHLGGDMMENAFDFSELIETLQKILDVLWEIVKNNPEERPLNKVTRNAVTPVTPMMLLCATNRESLRVNGINEYLNIWFDLLFKDDKMVMVRLRDWVKALGYVPKNKKSMGYALTERLMQSLEMFNVKMIPNRTDKYWSQIKFYHKYDDVCVLWKEDKLYKEKKDQRFYCILDFVIKTGKLIRKNGADAEDIKLVLMYLESLHLFSSWEMELKAYLMWITHYEARRYNKWNNPIFREMFHERVKNEILIFKDKMKWKEEIKKFL